MPDDRRKAELEQEYLRYFPAVPEPKPPIVQRVVGGILAGILILYLVFIALDLILGAIFKYL